MNWCHLLGCVLGEIALTFLSLLVKVLLCLNLDIFICAILVQCCMVPRVLTACMQCQIEKKMWDFYIEPIEYFFFICFIKRQKNTLNCIFVLKMLSSSFHLHATTMETIPGAVKKKNNWSLCQVTTESGASLIHHWNWYCFSIDFLFYFMHYSNHPIIQISVFIL